MAPLKGKFTEKETVEIKKTHGDLGQEVIKITVDKLSLILHKHVSSIEGKKSWIAPLGIFITILVVLLTSRFEDTLLSKDTWKAIFIISEAITSLWLFKTAYGAFTSESIEDLIEKIKKQE